MLLPELLQPRVQSCPLAIREPIPGGGQPLGQSLPGGVDHGHGQDRLTDGVEHGGLRVVGWDKSRRAPNRLARGREPDHLPTGQRAAVVPSLAASVDVIITFTDHLGELQSVIVSVKSGQVNSGYVQQLKGAMETHKAAMGLIISLEEPTGPMRQEAATAGVYHSELTGRDYQRIQLLSIADHLERGRKADLPLFVLPAFAKAAKVKADDGSERQKLALGS